MKYSTQSDEKHANALRLRENQRRSRLRKKEYLASLETRLEEYKRAGTEATLEVQTAARHVVRENQRLRELLRVKGVPDKEVDAWVKDGQDTGGVSPLEGVFKALVVRRLPGNEGKTSGKGNARRTSAPAAINVRTQGIGSERPNYEQPDNGMSSPNSAPSPASSVSSYVSVHSQVSTQTKPASPAIICPTYVLPPSPQQYPPPHERLAQDSQDLYSFHSLHPSTPVFTEGPMSGQHYITASGISDQGSSLPCDVARTMIVELQPGESIDSLTSELCPGGSSHGCVVDTSILFGVMDKACM